ncbi:ribosomal RNA large subunit methyltransferase N [Buchnera aphidicola (Schlechtendalia chinensis)]|uniref:Dual-specificity RNA methyltransferase RlmN n=1 Tax=Buchnera aphidicola subsp. Schlechtendalia chinensis TaxID=118110 RepID=A0A172WDJ5_BUCSC|nr:23S rRNA (adenine(2503)-C(2))-methyltransferase RlmN [Buchnera aphidicola]ANF17048.1 ribosomal RNA large subunit methyltransferase N [Buchnera aphidicola (Schlechtendalia chinensis)]
MKNSFNISNNFKINLLNLNLVQMRNFFSSIGEPKFCANQVMQWIYKHYCDDFERMSNIGKSLKKKLSQLCCIAPPTFCNQINSIDGLIKWYVSIDNNFIETVYIPQKKRATLCISSQSGCALSCKFCFTGRQKFNRNLTTSEIIGQIWYIGKLIYKKKLKNLRKITNIVMMGMGEPLLNLNNVVNSLSIIMDDLGFNYSKNRVTVSTAGIVPALEKLKNMIDVSLAISLHAPNDIIRSMLMPINKKYNIKSLLHSVKSYLQTSSANRGKVTIEYVMLHDVNDKLHHAIELANLLKDIPSKINLIPWNVFPNSSYSPSNKDNIQNFSNTLIKKGYITKVRKTRGDDINAACGQLTGHLIDIKKL